MLSKAVIILAFVGFCQTQHPNNLEFLDGDVLTSIQEILSEEFEILSGKLERITHKLDELMAKKTTTTPTDTTTTHTTTPNLTPFEAIARFVEENFLPMGFGLTILILTITILVTMIWLVKNKNRRGSYDVEQLEMTNVQENM